MEESMRIEEHPIIDSFHKGSPVEFTLDGRTLTGYENEPISAALKAAGVQVHRHTRKIGEPRGIFCAIGRCTDCVMIVDGVANTRTCVTPLKAGMKIETQFGLERKGGSVHETV